MLKVLIIDDEPIIREGLKTIINWNSYGFNICGEAENGRVGLSKIKELDPDLAIVDIKMPGMDGLQMVEELRKDNKECKIIILTAYSDFKYAQKSIELGIEAYILKPIEQSELIEKVCKVRDSINAKKELKQCLYDSISLSRDKVIESLVLGQVDQEMIEKYNKLYGFNFPWKSYQVILIEIDKKNSNSITLWCNVKREIENFVSRNSYGNVFDIERYIGVLSKSISQAAYPRVFAELQSKVSDTCGVDITISLGIPVDSIGDIQLSYRNSCKLMDRKFVYGHKKILMDVTKEVAEKNDDIEGESKARIDIDGITEDLYNAIDVNNMDNINNLLEEIRCQFINNEYAEDVIKINYTNLYVALVSKLIVSTESIKDYLSGQKDVLDEILKKVSLQELHGYIKYKLVSISDEIAKLRPSNLMTKILDYIDRNYNKDIKLETLAALFNYNSAYLGKIFKTYTGKYFNTYLDLVRVEKAKQFLKEGLKVYQVAEKAGYKDIDYFYKKFKKYVGVSPSDYKGM